MKYSAYIIVFLVTVLQWTAAQNTTPMLISITGVRENVGQIMLFVFTNADDFPTKRDNAFRSKKIPATSSSMIVLLDSIPAGTYGVAVYHDENSNNKMDRHWYGMPKEGYGASNDATGTFGPPKFSDAKFEFSNRQDTVKIIIHY